ncbi:MAG: uL15 family ribosomal protein [Candidatus Pacebacteria bacterium]|nr:uL15 family ribosomal protein [Candidatus Paceibacterota bacterium]
MQSHSIQIKRKNKKRVGRGGSRGKTSGRGHKGQKQHGGHGIRPDIRDQIKKLPKLRGRGVNINTPVSKKATVINVETLEKVFKKGALVNNKTLLKEGLIRKEGKFFPKIKILGKGEISKELKVAGLLVSKEAKEKIEKAGGSVK